MSPRARAPPRDTPPHAPAADPHRALHDRLERAYLEVARTSPRFVEHETPLGRCIGFRGLDAAPMNRVVDARAATARDATRLLDAARAHYEARDVPWSVQLTPYRGATTLATVLVESGFMPVARLAVMTRDRSAALEAPRRRWPAGVHVRENDGDAVDAFTAVVVDAFRMPRAYHAPLTDIHDAWQRAGARLLVAVTDGRIVGTALVASALGVSGVYSVSTLSAHRGRGVASALMDAALDAHAESGNDVLTLQVDRATPAESFYARRGFVRQYDWTFYAHPGDAR